MSVMGTGIAAAVAQTAQQAEQLARKRDKRSRQARDASDRTREIFETHLKILEENDDTETTARLQVETDLTRYANGMPTAPGGRGGSDPPTYSKPQQAGHRVDAHHAATEAESADPQPAPTPQQAYQQQVHASDSGPRLQGLDVEA